MLQGMVETKSRSHVSQAAATGTAAVADDDVDHTAGLVLILFVVILRPQTDG